MHNLFNTLLTKNHGSQPSPLPPPTQQTNTHLQSPKQIPNRPPNKSNPPANPPRPPHPNRTTIHRNPTATASIPRLDTAKHLEPRLQPRCSHPIPHLS